MKEVDILGANHFALSMILETLVKINGEVKAYVWENVTANDHLEKDILYLPNNATVVRNSIQNYGNEERATYIAGMSPRSRKAIYKDFINLIKMDQLIPLIHPHCSVASTVIINPGVRFESSVIVASFTEIGFCSFLNRGVSVGHHASIGKYVNINPGVIIASQTTIGDEVTLGIGAVINDKIKIGKGSFIGSGSIVTKDIPEGVIAYGSPAKVIREISQD